MFGSWLIRTPMARGFLIAAVVLVAGGCAYFNTYYNADNLFDEAERLRTAKGGSADKASAQYDACIKKCHDLLRYHSKSKYVDDALYMIGVCHFHRSEYIQAQGSLRDLLDRFPNSDRAESAWYYLGLSALALGDRAGAASAFESLEKAYPSSSYRVDAAYRTAETFLDAGDSESMRRALTEFIAKNPDSRHVGAAQLRIADTYYDDSRFPEARAEYQKALEAGLTEEQRFEAELQIALTKRDEAELILTDPALYQESDLPAGLRLQIQEAATDSASQALSPAPALPESVLAQREQATKLLSEAESDLDDLRKQATKFGAELSLGVERAVTVSLLGKSAAVRIAAEEPDAEIAARYGEAPPIYSREINYWLMRAAIDLLKTRPDLGVVYVHTTDYAMHMWPPEADESQEHLATLDRLLGDAADAAPDAAFLVSADHGMNYKSRCWDLEKALAARGAPIHIAISAERDKYLRHHRGMGGTSWVHLNDPGEALGVAAVLQSLDGVERVLTREQAAREFHLMASRIGDLVVLGDRDTVFGNLEQDEMELLPQDYRSHGSLHESDVPLIIHNARSAPQPAYFQSNLDLARWVYADEPVIAELVGEEV
jgi:phosphonoacetate hydrolase